MIVCDTREKKNAHILKAFEKSGTAYTVRKMDVGDYQIEGRDGVVVDRKQNLDELCKNLCSRDNARFWRELRRAYERHIKLVIVCEHGGNICELRDVAKWESRHSFMSGRQLLDRMCDVKAAYGVEFVFCEKRDTARVITDILEAAV
ncbi:MAG: ERCC4 domain-containing protein [Ruminococcus sp.]|nr:ERCC4 domain-containing protein [Ruminococcus sp.]MCM1380309.1 ERCC4 domain-containing protein [Muribaculaceae bacterium]MCM1478289.1 ERCC4 domain-containing protein [Muribaculaceae bacterium]